MAVATSLFVGVKSLQTAKSCVHPATYIVLASLSKLAFCRIGGPYVEYESMKADSLYDFLCKTQYFFWRPGFVETIWNISRALGVGSMVLGI